MDMMGCYYEVDGTGAAPNLGIGDVCVARSGGDQYHRVEVMEICDDDVLCYYLDLGDQEYVNIRDLRTIKKEFLKLPYQVSHTDCEGN